ncbi:MAG: hypothetical protein SV062_05410 [Thermodesulfobacteriota bacterium]|nr:hypothetical protein [Thermodesulfobacteriota bacterium]
MKDKSQGIFIIVDPFEKVRTYSASYKVIKCVVFFSVVAMSFTLYFTFAYFNIKNNEQDLTEKNSLIEGTLKNLQKKLKIKDDIIKKIYHNENVEKNLLTDSNHKITTRESIFYIKNFKAGIDKKTSINLDISFDIVCNKEKEKPHTGYLFIVVRIKNSDSQPFIVYPSMPAEGGYPGDYLKGLAFSIRKLKKISALIPLKMSDISISYVNIYIFSKNGQLLQKEPIKLNI